MQSEGSLPRSVDRHLRQTNAGLHVHYACPVRVCMYAVCTSCCIRRGPGGERIVYVVPGGTELEPRVKTGSRAGCSHS